MIENLLKLVLSNSQSEIIENDAIPNEHNHAAVSATAESITETLQKTLANGGFKQVLGLIGGKTQASNSSLTNQMIESLSANLSSRFGVNPIVSKTIASTLIPKILNSLIQQTNDKNNNNFDISNILGVLSGGKAQNLNLSQILEKIKISKTDEDDNDDEEVTQATQNVMRGAQENKIDFAGLNVEGIVGKFATGLLGNLFK